MAKKLFFKPTALYKEYIILDSIEYNPNITQRDLARIAKASLSMINQYLDNYEQMRYITKKYISKKEVIYSITNKGKERKRLLNIDYLNEVHKGYKEAKKETVAFLNNIIEKGFKDIIFYGAGEVSEILLQTLSDNNRIPLNVSGIIDDNVEKQGQQILGYTINSNKIIESLQHDAIMIASFNYFDEIYNKLMAINYPKDKIVYFFE